MKKENDFIKLKMEMEVTVFFDDEPQLRYMSDREQQGLAKYLRTELSGGKSLLTLLARYEDKYRREKTNKSVAHFMGMLEDFRSAVDGATMEIIDIKGI